jgi:hypothetical protein
MAGSKFNNGYFQIPRSEINHPFLAEDRPFTKKEAWLDICSQATFRQRTVPYKLRNGTQSILLNPGELIASERNLAEDWQWSKGKVSRFLQDAEALGWLKRVSTTPVNIVRVMGLDEAYEGGPQNGPQTSPQRKPSKSSLSAQVEPSESPESGAQNEAPYKKGKNKDQNNISNSYTDIVEVTSNTEKNNKTGEVHRFLAQLKNWYIFSKSANLSNYVTEDRSAIDIRTEIHRMYGEVISLKEGPGVTEEMILEITSRFSRYGFLYQN